MATALVLNLPFGEGGGAYAQMSVTALPKVWAGGYHIKCNGGTDGEINTVVTGNVGPYTVVWSNAATSTLINGLVAGTYWVTATDSLSNTASDTVVLVQPGLLTAGIGAHTFNNGTHISEHGASDGEMYSNIQGGIPPYTYLWAPGGHTGHTYKDLPAGEYHLTVTDAGGCTAQAQQTLTEPALFTATLHITERSGGVHLSCAGANDGEARAEASGGVPPYTYSWTGSPTTDSLATDLPAGPQALKVADANGVVRAIEFELTAPEKLAVEIETNDLYPNGYHVSCHDCANATLTAQVTGGTGPFEYYWYRNQENGTAQLLNAGEPFYQVFVKDANGCPGGAMVKLRIPERDDWSVNGNSGVTAAIPPALGVEQRWLGTNDETDLLMKANNQPMLRVGADGITEFYGGVKMGGLEEADSVFTSMARAMMVGADGTLKIGGSGGWPVAPVLDDPCLFYYGPNGEYNFVPTWVNGPGKIWTAAPCDANVGIGTSNPEHKLHVNGETFTVHLKVGTQIGDARATIKGGQGNTGKTLEVLNNSSTSAFTVFNDGSAVFGNNALRVTADGNAGVGTDTPNSKLHVAGNIEITGNRLHVNASSGNIGIGTQSPGHRIHVLATADDPNPSMFIQPLNYGLGNRASIFLGNEYQEIRAFENYGGIGFLSPNLIRLESPRIGINESNPQANLHINALNSPYAAFHITANNGEWTTGMIIESTAENNKSNVVRRGDWTNFEVRSNGTVYARNVWVKLGGFPDFVFSKDYPLPTINEVKRHIRENGKLSELPSAAQVEIEGIDLGEMNKLLVKKVEELTLYVIQLHEAIELLKADCGYEK